MLQCASWMQERTSSMACLGSVVWVAGEATSLTVANALQGCSGQIDLLLFGVGSVSHLVGADEPACFFSEVVKLLCPGSGCLYLLVLSEVVKLLCPGSGCLYLLVQDNLISSRCITHCLEETATWSEIHDQKDFPSELYEGLVYRQLLLDASTTNGPIKMDCYRFLVLKQTAAGEEMVEANNIEVFLRVWAEQELLDWATEAGLKCVQMLHSSHEMYYVLSRAS